jgi:hypothetical protein
MSSKTVFPILWANVSLATRILPSVLVKNKVSFVAFIKESNASSLSLSAFSMRVCRAWHRTYGVKVPVPGFRGAEGKEKGKGVVVRRGLEEAQSETAGR